MKKAILILLPLFVSAVVLAQSQLDVTVYDGHRLKPDASKKEMMDWAMARMFESAMTSAINPQSSQLSQQSGLNAQQMQLLRHFCVRTMVLEELLKRHPEIKPEADALHVQADAALTQHALSQQQPAQR